MKERLLTPKELAEQLCVSQAWIRDHVSGRRKPLLPYVRLGDKRGQIRFRPSQIDTFCKYIRATPRNDA